MAAKRRKPSGPRWPVILEEMRSQNRATIEHVDMIRTSLEQRIDRLHDALGTCATSLEMAFRELTRRFGTLPLLEGRVTAIEKRLD